MFQTKQIAWILTIVLAMSLLLASCGGKRAAIETTDQPAAGQTKLISAEPVLTPVWLQDPGSESDQENLAFKGTSLDTAHPRDAERFAYRDARVAIGSYLFTHVSSRVNESFKYSGVSSGIYDAQIAEETVNKVATDVFVNRAYPSKYYTEYFKRYERGRWVYFYRTQALVKFPRDEVARAAQLAQMRILKRLKEDTKDLSLQTKIQGIVDQVENQSAVAGTVKEGNLWALLVGIDRYKSLGITPLNFAARDAEVFADALSEVTPKRQVWVMTNDMEDENEPTNTNIMF